MQQILIYWRPHKGDVISDLFLFLFISQPFLRYIVVHH